MAAIFDKTSNRMTLRLNTGADPNTGKAVLKTVGFAIVPTATADQANAAKTALAPLLIHPTIAVEVSGVEVLGDDGN